MPPDTTVLSFDTSAAHCAVALLRGDRIIAQRLELMQKGQAERLMPLIEETLAEADLIWSDLTAIGVGIGPGNFTGIRISVAAARGLALSLGIPAVGVSTLEAQVFGIKRPVASLVPARGGKTYIQFFDADTSAPEMVDTDALPAQLHDLSAYTRDPSQLNGDISAETPPTTLAEAIARIAAMRYTANPTRPAPLYIRPADAAPPRDPAPKILL